MSRSLTSGLGPKTSNNGFVVERRRVRCGLTEGMGCSAASSRRPASSWPGGLHLPMKLPLGLLVSSSVRKRAADGWTALLGLSCCQLRWTASEDEY
jgi:hypothetical protein